MTGQFAMAISVYDRAIVLAKSINDFVSSLLRCSIAPPSQVPVSTRTWPLWI